MSTGRNQLDEDEFNFLNNVMRDYKTYLSHYSNNAWRPVSFEEFLKNYIKE